MATYTNVPDSVLEPGDPIRSVDIIAIKDNIEHYAENNGTTTVFTAPGTWTKPATVKRVKVTVVGAGGNGGAGNTNPAPDNVAGGNGGGGGASIRWIPAPSIPGPVAVTRGSAPSKTSSFGAFLSATGGVNGTNAPGATNAPFGPYAGGSGSGGDLNFSGENGHGIGSVTGGRSGGSGLAFGPGITTSAPATSGKIYGGGGTGRFGPGAGGTGANGVVIVEEFY